MSDSFIYPCLVHLMHIIESKESNIEQDYYHTHIITTHFIQSKQLFQTNSLFYQTILNFYQQKLTSFNNNNQVGENDLHRTGEIGEKKNIKLEQQSVLKIIIGIITIGIKALMGVEVNCQMHKHVIQLCEELHQTLAFQGLSISQVLLKFIPKLTKSIKNLVFYQNILKIFLTLDFYQIINFLQETIDKFREEWQKKQQQIQSNTFKASRQTRHYTSIKRNVSLEQDEKGKQNQQARQNIKSVSKIVQKPSSIPHSNFKKILPPNKRIPPSSSRRRTFNIDKAYKYNVRQTTSNFHQSIASVERQNILKKQHYSWKDVGYESYGRRHGGEKYLVDQSEDVLADSTPNKKKKVHNKRN